MTLGGRPSAVNTPAEIADHAMDYLRRTADERRRRLWERLERLNQTIADWEEWRANQELPAELRRELVTPSLSLDAWVAIRRTVLDELVEYESGWACLRPEEMR